MKPCYFHKDSRTIVDLYNHPFEANHLIISRVNVPKMYRGMGLARRIMCEVLKDADEEQITLSLEVVPSGGLDDSQLRAWYRRLGFVDQAGIMMTRRPAPMNVLALDKDRSIYRTTNDV